MLLYFIVIITCLFYGVAYELGFIVLPNDVLYETDCPNNGTWCNCKQGSCFTNWDGKRHCNYAALYENINIVVHIQAVLTGGQ
jgi:hypothetical protein